MRFYCQPVFVVTCTVPLPCCFNCTACCIWSQQGMQYRCLHSSSNLGWEQRAWGEEGDVVVLAARGGGSSRHSESGEAGAGL